MSTVSIVKWPFFRTVYDLYDEGVTIPNVPTWAPGIYAQGEDFYGEGEISRCDALGSMVLTGLGSCSLNGPYLDRVFFIREWIDPDGRKFGKRTVRVCTVRKFASMLKGWRSALAVEDRGIDGAAAWRQAFGGGK